MGKANATRDDDDDQSELIKSDQLAFVFVRLFVYERTASVI